MTFMPNQGWCCQFLEADLKTPLPRKFAIAVSKVNPKPLATGVR